MRKRCNHHGWHLFFFFLVELFTSMFFVPLHLSLGWERSVPAWPGVSKNGFTEKLQGSPPAIFVPFPHLARNFVVSKLHLLGMLPTASLSAFFQRNHLEICGLISLYLSHKMITYNKLRKFNSKR